MKMVLIGPITAILLDLSFGLMTKLPVDPYNYSFSLLNKNMNNNENRISSLTNSTFFCVHTKFSPSKILQSKGKNKK